MKAPLSPGGRGAGVRGPGKDATLTRPTGTLSRPGRGGLDQRERVSFFMEENHASRVKILSIFVIAAAVGNILAQGSGVTYPKTPKIAVEEHTPWDEADG